MATVDILVSVDFLLANKPNVFRIKSDQKISFLLASKPNLLPFAAPFATLRLSCFSNSISQNKCPCHVCVSLKLESHWNEPPHRTHSVFPHLFIRFSRHKFSTSRTLHKLFNVGVNLPKHTPFKPYFPFLPNFIPFYLCFPFNRSS